MILQGAACIRLEPARPPRLSSQWTAPIRSVHGILARHEASTNFLERDCSKSCAKTASQCRQAANVGGPRADRQLPDRDEPGDPFGRRDAGQEKPIKIGAKVVRHGRKVAFQITAVAIPRYLVAGVPRLIVEPRPPPAAASRQVFDPHESLSGARRANLIGLGVHRGEGSALPKSVERGNLCLDKAVIRWVSSGGRGGASPQPCTSLRRVAGCEKVFA
jgi:hypothetical protein